MVGLPCPTVDRTNPNPEKRMQPQRTSVAAFLYKRRYETLVEILELFACGVYS